MQFYFWFFAINARTLQVRKEFETAMDEITFGNERFSFKESVYNVGNNGLWFLGKKEQTNQKMQIQQYWFNQVDEKGMKRLAEKRQLLSILLTEQIIWGRRENLLLWRKE